MQSLHQELGHAASSQASSSSQRDPWAAKGTNSLSVIRKLTHSSAPGSASAPAHKSRLLGESQEIDLIARPLGRDRARAPPASTVLPSRYITESDQQDSRARQDSKADTCGETAMTAQRIVTTYAHKDRSRGKEQDDEVVLVSHSKTPSFPAHQTGSTTDYGFFDDPGSSKTTATSKWDSSIARSEQPRPAEHSRVLSASAQGASNKDQPVIRKRPKGSNQAVRAEDGSNRVTEPASKGIWRPGPDLLPPTLEGIRTAARLAKSPKNKRVESQSERPRPKPRKKQPAGGQDKQDSPGGKTPLPMRERFNGSNSPAKRHRSAANHPAAICMEDDEESDRDGKHDRRFRGGGRDLERDGLEDRVVAAPFPFTMSPPPASLVPSPPPTPPLQPRGGDVSFDDPEAVSPIIMPTFVKTPARTGAKQQDADLSDMEDLDMDAGSPPPTSGLAAASTSGSSRGQGSNSRSAARLGPQPEATPFPMTLNPGNGSFSMHGEDLPLRSSQRSGIAGKKRRTITRTPDSDVEMSDASAKALSSKDEHTSEDENGDSDWPRSAPIQPLLTGAMAEKECQPYMSEHHKCNFCHEPLPLRPSDTLQTLLNQLRSAAHHVASTSKATNLEWTRSIAACVQHRAETHTIPLGEKAGYPTELYPRDVCKRVQGKAIKDRLMRVADDPKASPYFLLVQRDVTEAGGKRQWLSLEDNLLATNERLQPGYYGTIGRDIITNTIRGMLSGRVVSAEMSPLTTTEFIVHVLVPEAAIMLVQEDLRSTGEGRKGREIAIKVLKQSVQYGLVRFGSSSLTPGDLLATQRIVSPDVETLSPSNEPSAKRAAVSPGYRVLSLSGGQQAKRRSHPPKLRALSPSRAVSVIMDCDESDAAEDEGELADDNVELGDQSEDPLLLVGTQSSQHWLSGSQSTNVGDGTKHGAGHAGSPPSRTSPQFDCDNDELALCPGDYDKIDAISKNPNAGKAFNQPSSREGTTDAWPAHPRVDVRQSQEPGPPSKQSSKASSRSALPLRPKPQSGPALGMRRPYQPLPPKPILHKTWEL